MRDLKHNMKSANFLLEYIYCFVFSTSFSRKQCPCFEKLKIYPKIFPRITAKKSRSEPKVADVTEIGDRYMDFCRLVPCKIRFETLNDKCRMWRAV